MGEVFLGAFLVVLLERLASRELLKFLRPSGIYFQLKKWRTTLLMIESVLTDAENKQTSNRAVCQWLNDLEDLAYDIEDLIDLLNTEALERKLNENHEASWLRTSKVRNFIPASCTNSCLEDFISDPEIRAKMKDIDGKLNDLAKQISVLDLVENLRSSDRTGEKLQTSSVVVKSEVHGREKDLEVVLNMLLEDESSDSPISVIPIVGMGGVGKTTLAQLVYNDGRIKDEFDLRAWTCVSNEFNAFEITKNILKSFSFERCDILDFPILQVKLKEYLSNKKFLVVLDDVWNENYGDWDILSRPFLAGTRGSKIIVTTQHERVAKIMSAIPAYHLDVLSDEDALSLLAQHALRNETFDARPDLREIGKSVVRRCQNLPLAVKGLGGLLRTTNIPKDWEDVLNSKFWTKEETTEILLSLKRSYEYLPIQLKRCFAYCSLFPKDYVFDKYQLVYLWIAEGFVQESKNVISLGSEYFDELLARSFFQQSSYNASCFAMHDLLNDLAMFVAGDKYLRMDDVKENPISSISEKVHWVSFIGRGHESYSGFNFVKAQSLRTFLLLPNRKKSSREFLSQIDLLELMPKLYCSRVLSLNGYSLYELPNSIGDLRNLQCLNLAETLLKWLPESVSTLIKLQILILRGCSRLAKLPASMENLINLRHLDTANTNQLHEMPRGIAQLTSLGT